MRLPLSIVEEQSNQASVYHSAICDDLVLNELAESEPDFVYALHILFHDPLARASRAHVQLLLDLIRVVKSLFTLLCRDEGLFGVVRGDLADEVLLCDKVIA